MATLRGTRPPEVLAPAGGWEQARAAVAAGADAVYFGLDDFNARARAANFRLEELADLMAEVHEAGVLGFVTLNTLLFQDELRRAERFVRAMADASVDAVIVQDLGVAQLIRHLCPALSLHGSTQLTVTSAEGVDRVARLGFERVVLARELSLREIAWIRAGTSVELEVFVHGALCVSYSGQCFSSEAWGGRSANRGQCAQACRLPYVLEVDGAEQPTGDAAYLLSPQDLAGLRSVPALTELGVSCLKIEGRLKGAPYVALTTAAYRKAVDRAWRGDTDPVDPAVERELEQIFSRGLTPGFLEGVQHQRLVRGRAPRHRGRRVGTVVEARGERIAVALEGPLKAGDGLVFDQARPQEEEPGGRVFSVEGADGARWTDERSEGVAWVRMVRPFPVERLRAGDWVWRTRDEALEAAALKRVREAPHTRPVTAVVRGRVGEPLHLTLRDEQGVEGSARTESVAQPARARALDVATLRERVGRLGDTPLHLDTLEAHLEGELFLPLGVLNQLRRDAADALLRARRQGSRPVLVASEDATAAIEGALRAPSAAADPCARSVSLHTLCRTAAQVDAVLSLPERGDVLLDFLEVKGVREAVARVRAAGRRAVAVTPRVLKPNEERISRFYLSLGADALLVRSLGMLHTLTNLAEAERPTLYGDFSLNATNTLSAWTLLGWGLQRLALGHDLNAAQLRDLVARLPAQRLEIIAHHHLPIFHTEHCVFARFMSEGEDFRTCGRPCERHDVALRDQRGRAHRVLADMGCRNTVFNAEAQSGAWALPTWLEAGVRDLRIELLDEGPEEVAALQEQYGALADGESRPEVLWSWLARRPQGVTQGSLVVPREVRT